MKLSFSVRSPIVAVAVCLLFGCLPFEQCENGDEEVCSQCPEEPSEEETSEALSAIARQITNPDREITDDSFGFVAKLEQGSGTCTGSLIAKNVLLTAAHCVEADFLPQYKVHVRYKGKTRILNVKEMRRHPKKGFKDGPYDLALLLLDNSCNLNLSPVALSPTPLKAGETIRFLGFGRTDAEDSKSHGKLYFGTDVYRPSTNEAPHENTLSESFRQHPDNKLSWSGAISSSKGTQYGSSIAEGDSGGPVLGPLGLVGVTRSVSVMKEQEHSISYATELWADEAQEFLTNTFMEWNFQQRSTCCSCKELVYESVWGSDRFVKNYHWYRRILGDNLNKALCENLNNSGYIPVRSGDVDYVATESRYRYMNDCKMEPDADCKRPDPKGLASDPVPPPPPRDESTGGVIPTDEKVFTTASYWPQGDRPNSGTRLVVDTNYLGTRVGTLEPFAADVVVQIKDDNGKFFTYTTFEIRAIYLAQ